MASAAPLDAAALAGALAPLGEATMLPAEAYVSPDVLAWERRHLFAGTWTCVGREDDLRSMADESASQLRAPRERATRAVTAPPGNAGAATSSTSASPIGVDADRPAPGKSGLATQRAVQVGDVGVLLTWSDRLRAFANTCRHRGHELLPVGEPARRHSIVCPYHAWSYDLSGPVRATPGVVRTDGTDLGLVELPVERWEGWVFVHAAHALGDPLVPRFADHLGALDALVAPYRTGSLTRLARHTYEVTANWKVITENYHECYHCPLIHPELCRVSPPDSGDNHDLPGAWVGGSMILRGGAETMSLTGQSGGRPLPGVDPGRVEYLGLFPNLLLSLHPDYVMTHRLTPLAPDRTAVECSWYFDGVVDPAYAVDFWDLTNRQDWAACASVQRGLSSPHFRPGPFAPNEDAVHRFVSMVARAYVGHPLAPAPI